MITRRKFYKLVAGAALVPVLASASIGPWRPVLYGNGVQDDTEALQALLDGEIVEFARPEVAAGAGWADNVLSLPEGEYRLTEPLRITGAHGVRYNFRGSRAVVDHGQEVFNISGSSDLDINGLSFDCYQQCG